MSSADLDSLRASLTDTACAALDAAAAGREAGQPVSTLDVLSTLSKVDTAGQWERIWLRCGEPSPAVSSRYLDPVPSPGGRWRGQPVTGTCTVAIRAAVALAARSGALPVPAGVLAVCLVGEATTAASRALGVRSPADHAGLLELAQEALAGSSWDNAGAVLAACLREAAEGVLPSEAAEGIPAGEAEDDMGPLVADAVNELGDRYQQVIDVTNAFVRADTMAERGRLIEEHAELLGPAVARIIDRWAEHARAAGDRETERRVRARQDLLENYRLAAGRPLPRAAEGGGQFGECPANQHVMEQSLAEKPGYQAVAIRCATCEAGHLIEMTATAGGAIQVDCHVFPAAGCHTISWQVKAIAITLWEGTVKDVEADGRRVIRGTPVFGLRPESLALHTSFTPLA
jgi:hypothetical protein